MSNHLLCLNLSFEKVYLEVLHHHLIIYTLVNHSLFFGYICIKFAVPEFIVASIFSLIYSLLRFLFQWRFIRSFFCSWFQHSFNKMIALWYDFNTILVSPTIFILNYTMIFLIIFKCRKCGYFATVTRVFIFFNKDQSLLSLYFKCWNFSNVSSIFSLPISEI